MLKKSAFVVAALVAFGAGVWADGPRRVAMGDWPEIRGPYRDGTSKETGLPEKWDPKGENLLWRAPYGGRSTPVVVGNRVYLQNPSGHGETLQERVMALDADTGKVIWEFKYNNFQSDVPSHRIAWASPSVDPETGNVYAITGAATALCLSKDGKLLWHRSIGEEWAAFTTHGGRTMSPLVDGDLVVFGAAVSNWGTLGARTHKLIALDKRTGDTTYVSDPGVRPYDTAYATPIIETINGLRLFIVGLGDGGVYAVKPQTGEKVWGTIIAKRGINTGVVVKDNMVFVSHGDENLTENSLGMIGAIDGSQTGEIKGTIWDHKGEEFGFSSPILDGDRLYQIDNSSLLKAYDAKTGKQLYEHRLGTVQRASPAFGDGKLYVGNDNGRFYILKPGPDKVEVLSEVVMPVSKNSCCGSEGTPEQILSGPAISRGRIYVMTSDAVYTIGPKQPKALTGFAVDETLPAGSGPATHVQVAPTELLLKPGQTAKLKARLFDAKGNFLRETTTATWTLEGLKGTIKDGVYAAGSEVEWQAGLIKATVDGVTGQARARVTKPLPWTETFEGFADGTVPPGWSSMIAGPPPMKFVVTTLEGNKALHKPPNNTLFKRIRVFMGPTDLSNYTIEADVRAPTKRRQMADVGVTAQRYSLVLYGTQQQMKLEPWEPETQRTVKTPYEWKADTWHHLKLRVENMPDGKVRARGKAWPTGQPEPAAWMIDKVDPIGNREGAPGFFIDAEFGVYIDNVKLTPNQEIASNQ